MPFGPERAKHEAAYVRAKRRAIPGVKRRVYKKWWRRMRYHWDVCQGYRKLGMAKE